MEYDVVVWQDTLSDGSICYAAICPAVDVKTREILRLLRRVGFVQSNRDTHISTTHG